MEKVYLAEKENQNTSIEKSKEFDLAIQHIEWYKNYKDVCGITKKEISSSLLYFYFKRLFHFANLKGYR